MEFHLRYCIDSMCPQLLENYSVSREGDLRVSNRIENVADRDQTSKNYSITIS